MERLNKNNSPLPNSLFPLRLVPSGLSCQLTQLILGKPFIYPTELFSFRYSTFAGQHNCCDGFQSNSIGSTRLFLAVEYIHVRQYFGWQRQFLPSSLWPWNNLLPCNMLHTCVGLFLFQSYLLMEFLLTQFERITRIANAVQ